MKRLMFALAALTLLATFFVDPWFHPSLETLKNINGIVYPWAVIATMSVVSLRRRLTKAEARIEELEIQRAQTAPDADQRGRLSPWGERPPL